MRGENNEKIDMVRFDAKLHAVIHRHDDFSCLDKWHSRGHLIAGNEKRRKHVLHSTLDIISSSR
jgi:hypothetical protein